MKTLTFMAAAALSLIPLRAGNIVLNGGFETGDFSSWTVTEASPSSTDLAVHSGASSGSFSAAFAAVIAGDYDSISQTVPTVNGQQYTFSFFLAGQFASEQGAELTRLARRGDATLDPVADFQAFWNGTMVLDVPAGSQSQFDFAQFTFNETGSGSDVITFKGYNVPSAYSLDDVSVATTPEPSALAFTLAGVALVMVRGMRRKTV